MFDEFKTSKYLREEKKKLFSTRVIPEFVHGTLFSQKNRKNPKNSAAAQSYSTLDNFLTSTH